VLLAERDPEEQLSGFAAITRAVMSRTAPLYRILVSAASSDPDAAALLAEQTAQRQRGQSLIARSLARADALRPKLRERDAADIIHALMSPEVYQLLVIDRSWTPERYEQWLKGILIDQLLPIAPSGRGRSDT
jgi:predicted membrane chloride channel (bestrophin family)